MTKFENEYFNSNNGNLLFTIEEIVSSKNDNRRKPKLPKGTRDFEPS